MKNKKSNLSAQAGFIQLIIIIVVALLLMRYFDITISGVLGYFGLTIPEIVDWSQRAWEWFKDLFNSVK